MLDLQTASFHFIWSPEQASYSLVSLPSRYPKIIKAGLDVRYFLDGHARRISKLEWSLAVVTFQNQPASPHGPLQYIHLIGESDRGRLHFEVNFALAEQQPLFLCQVKLENRSSHPLSIDRITFFEAGPDSIHLSPSGQDELAFFANGWQSWSYCGAYGVGETAHRSHLGPFRAPLLVNPGTPQPRHTGHFASDFFGVLGDRTHRSGLLVGFLSQMHQFGSLEAWPGSGALSLWANGDRTRLDPGKCLETDPAVICSLDLDDLDPLAPYIEAVSRQHHLDLKAPIFTGWCSWYQFYNHVTADDISRNLNLIAEFQAELPLRLVQIDDGFETKFGDWFSSKSTFPGGLTPLVKEIRSAGLTPGIWLAPFMVNPRSRLAHDHPDYILRSAWGLPVISGATEESWINTALDLSHPGALDYACQVVRTAAKEWGFPYLKLDFLSAGALAGRRHDDTRSRAQILRSALEALRQAAGQEAYLMGCGAPLGSSIGIFDALRIGEDVSPAWEPHIPVLPALFRKEAEFPSTRNAIHSTLERAFLHRRWWINDPDCLLLRPDSRLTLAEIQALVTAICFSGGTFLVSDDLQNLPPDRLRLAASLLPPIGKRPYVLDWFDTANPSRLRLDLDGPAGTWYLLARFNWDDRPKDTIMRFLDYRLPSSGAYWARSFWDQKTCLVRNGEFEIKGLPPHGVALLAVQPFLPGQPQYLGSDLHISQGMEVAGWQAYRQGLRLHLELPRLVNGQIELYLPFEPESVTLAGPDKIRKIIPFQQVGVDQYLIKVDLNRSAVIEISKRE